MKTENGKIVIVSSRAATLPFFSSSYSITPSVRAALPPCPRSLSLSLSRGDGDDWAAVAAALLARRPGILRPLRRRRVSPGTPTPLGLPFLPCETEHPNPNGLFLPRSDPTTSVYA